MKISLQKMLLLGLIAELIIFLVSYVLHPNIEVTFQYAARYSGRLSAVIFLVAFYTYAAAFPIPMRKNSGLRNLIRVFAVLHVIHFGFLAANVYLNEIPLVPVKLSGGALAYLMIVLAPFKLHQLKIPWQLTYFYYVTFVMIMTYVARAKGDFEGAESSWFHYVALAVFVGCAIVFGLGMFRKRKGDSSLKNIS